MRWDLLGVVFRKEVVDSLRDRRTLAMVLFFPVFGPIVLASTLSLVSRQARDVDEKPLALPVVAPDRFGSSSTISSRSPTPAHLPSFFRSPSW
jgi:ABC-type Na+ efflux pump permease subunit